MRELLHGQDLATLTYTLLLPNPGDTNHVKDGRQSGSSSRDITTHFQTEQGDNTAAGHDEKIRHGIALEIRQKPDPSYSQNKGNGSICCMVRVLKTKHRTLQQSHLPRAPPN